MDAQTLTLLLGPDGQALLSALPEYDPDDALKLGTSLRDSGYDPALVAAVLSQAKLRQEGRAKFGEFADGMLFTRDGLEQATRLPVAALHAGRFQRAGLTRVTDMGSGIGGDAIAMAGLGLAVDAVDADEVTAAIATYNLRHFDDATVRQGTAEEADLAGIEGLWCDPARRRTKGRGKKGQATRLTDPEEFSPPFSWVLGAAEQVPAMGVKLGPALAHDDIPEAAEAQWVSHRGDVVEVVLWFGSVARPDVRRSALVIGSGGTLEVTDSQLPEGEAPDVGTEGPGGLGRYLFEPDGAIIRAGLVAALWGPLQVRPVSERIAYLTGDEPRDTPAARRWEIIDVLPMNVAKLSSRLAELGVGRVEIKKRGADIVPEKIRKQLKLRGKDAATVFFTRIGERHAAIIGRELTPGKGAT